MHRKIQHWAFDSVCSGEALHTDLYHGFEIPCWEALWTSNHPKPFINTQKATISKIKTKVLKGKTISGSAIHRIISSSLFAESDGLVWLQSTLATAFLKPPRHYRHNLSPRHAGSRKDVMKYFLNQAWSEDRLLQPSTFTVSAWWSVPAIAIPCILVHHEKVEEHKEHAKAKPDLAVFQLLNGHLMQIMNLPVAQLVVWLQNATGCSWTHETSCQLANHGFHV